MRSLPFRARSVKKEFLQLADMKNAAKPITACLIAVFLALSFGAIPVQATPPTHLSSSPVQTILRSHSFNAITTAASLNWAGYAIASLTAGSVTDVKGSFTIPTVSCNTNNAFASFWVGIDGFNSNTVEQTGVTANPCNSSFAPHGYSAWFEFFPAAPVYASASLAPGETVSAEVTFTPSTGIFTTSISVKSGSTTVATLTHSQTVSGAQSTSAEWIAEAPSVSGRILPLANFGSITFTSASATVGGTTGSISTTFPSSTNNEIVMVTRGGTVKAQPSGLSSNGTSFSVTWKHQ
jgi:Peptidase A4 family